VTVYDDTRGKLLFPAQVVEALAQVASAPVYGPSDTYLGRGVVGGYMDSFELMGASAADLALEILAGRSPSTIDRQPSQNRRFLVDVRQLLRWQLSESNLPADTVLSFKQMTLWEEHHDTWPRRRILVARGLSGGWLHHGCRSRCQPDSQC
jgi:hypothetical protein